MAKKAAAILVSVALLGGLLAASPGAAQTATTKISLTRGWNLVAWPGPTMPVGQALAGGPNGPASGTSNVTHEVGALWGYDATTQTWQGYFPAAANVPGANDLTKVVHSVGYFVYATTAVQWFASTISVAPSPSTTPTPAIIIGGGGGGGGNGGGGGGGGPVAEAPTCGQISIGFNEVEFLYVANEGDSTISAFSMLQNGADGADSGQLCQLASSPVDDPGNSQFAAGPKALAAVNYGNSSGAVEVANSGTNCIRAYPMGPFVSDPGGIASPVTPSCASLQTAGPTQNVDSISLAEPVSLGGSLLSYCTSDQGSRNVFLYTVNAGTDTISELDDCGFGPGLQRTVAAPQDPKQIVTIGITPQSAAVPPHAESYTIDWGGSKVSLFAAPNITPQGTLLGTASGFATQDPNFSCLATHNDRFSVYSGVAAYPGDLVFHAFDSSCSPRAAATFVLPDDPDYGGLAGGYCAYVLGGTGSNVISEYAVVSQYDPKHQADFGALEWVGQEAFNGIGTAMADINGNAIAVTDSFNNELRDYGIRKDDCTLAPIGAVGTGPDPVALAFGPGGVFVVNAGNETLGIFGINSNRQIVAVTPSGPSTGPGPVAVVAEQMASTDAACWVINQGNNSISEYGYAPPSYSSISLLGTVATGAVPDSLDVIIW